VRALLLVVLALVTADAASATSIPAAMPEADEALLFALGLMGLGAGLSRPAGRERADHLPPARTGRRPAPPRRAPARRT
jgi:hypothetical protein